MANLTQKPLSRIRSFWFGLKLPFQAAKVIGKNPVLIFWSLVPIAITLALYGYIIVQMQEQARLALSHAFVGWGLDPHGWVAWGALVLAKLLLFLIGALSFSLVATIAACPFNDFLAEKAETRATPALTPVAPQPWSAKARLLGLDILKSVAATGASLVALMLSWMPFVNVLALIVTFLLFCFQYISYPQTRRGLGVNDGFQFIWRHFFACLGFGATISILFAIPIVSSFCLPLAVVAGTLLVARAPGVDGSPTGALPRLR